MTKLETITKSKEDQPKAVTVQKNQYELYQVRYNQYISNAGLTVNPESIKTYLDTLADMSASTQRKAKTSLKQALENMTINPVNLFLIQKEFKRIKIKKPDKKIIKYLTKEQIKVIKANATERVGLIIECLEVTGLRISELLSIKKTDIEYDNDLCYVRVLGKGKKERTVYMTLELVESLKKTFKGAKYLIESRSGKALIR